MSLQPCPAPAHPHPDLHQFLSDKGFEAVSPDSFSNGRATIRFEGPVMFAISGKGKVWRATVGSASPQQLMQLLTPVLNSDSFLSPAELERRAQRAQTAKLALDHIVQAIREAPDRPGSRELGRFLWSLFNGHHELNLWRLRDELDSQRGAWVAEVFTAWMQGLVPDDYLRRALIRSGEMDRLKSSS